MQERVLGFINGLRGRGVSVSTAESLDAMGALTQVDFDDPEVFASALRTSLIKRTKDRPVFEELFPLYFYGLEVCEELSAVDDDLLHRLEEALESMQGEGGKMDALLPMLLLGRGEEWESIIRQAAGQVGTSQLATRMQVGMYTKRALDMLDWERAEEDLEKLLSRLEQAGLTCEELEEIREAFQANRDAFRKQMKRFMEREQVRNAGKPPSARSVEMLMARPLSTLDESELQQMRKVVDVLARKLRNKISLRERRVKRGKLDIKATLRKNMQHGGIPFELVMRHKRMEKAELMVLCDVSSSVARVSQFMLQFVYTIQDCLAKVRSFVFVDDLGEVTDFFQEEDIALGVKLALSRAGIPYNTRSDFGEVFRSFCDRYLQDVGYRTYVLIIGDARNNYNDPCAWALEKISERAKGIIWLNPETRPFWDTGDSVMGDYLPYCREARVCRTLMDLEDTVSSLLL